MTEITNNHASDLVVNSKVESNITYSGHTSLFMIEATITELHTYTCRPISRYFLMYN